MKFDLGLDKYMRGMSVARLTISETHQASSEMEQRVIEATLVMDEIFRKRGIE